VGGKEPGDGKQYDEADEEKEEEPLALSRFGDRWTKL